MREVWVVESRWHTAPDNPPRWSCVGAHKSESVAKDACAAWKHAQKAAPRSFRVVRYTPAASGG